MTSDECHRIVVDLERAAHAALVRAARAESEAAAWKRRAEALETQWDQLLDGRVKLLGLGASDTGEDIL